MSPRLARTLLHTVHLVTFAVLMVTGLLLFLPSLRAVITGGYSLFIRQAHLWGGVAFAVLPILILLRVGLRGVFAAENSWGPRALWQAAHVALTLVMGVVFTATGFVLWDARVFPDGVVDPCRTAHDWFTYAGAALVGLHLLELGVAALIGRVKQAVATPKSGT